jgi:hypothetical protein
MIASEAAKLEFLVSIPPYANDIPAFLTFIINL